MASTLVHLYKIAIYESDGESLGNLVGYKSIDGDITEETEDIQYYSSEAAARTDVDNSDELELRMRDVIEPVYFDAEDTLNLDIKYLN